MTADIVAAYAGHNAVDAETLTAVIGQCHQSLSTIASDVGDAPAQMTDLNPAVPVRRSINPDYIVCLEDGRKLKMLKRYLRAAFNMTPEEYRARWGLPQDYPMVAPNYAKKRSDFAKKMGLGKR
ncbi:MAG: MucR family transcriptional regulator [Rhodospirillaceae bacterium]